MVRNKLWSPERRSNSKRKGSTDHRTPFQHDYDRLLFSTPVRRLADKTQVFPLDKNDGVRTRLTHSHEVSNLAKSIGTRTLKLLVKKSEEDKSDISYDKDMPTILAAIGLAHDIGNPPFGHQGEAAISSWFRDNKEWVFTQRKKSSSIINHESDLLNSNDCVPTCLHNEFLKFEGNAQTIRILTRLQVSSGDNGLDLTAATLAALMKYPISADTATNDTSNNPHQLRKYGFFESEYEVVDWVRKKTGLTPGARHPLTWIMEAADDIAYSVLDVEDAIKKGFLSPDDVICFMEEKLNNNYRKLISTIKDDFYKCNYLKRSSSDIRDIKSSYIRTRTIQTLINESINNFKKNLENIYHYQQRGGIIEKSKLCNFLKHLARSNVFSSPSVLRIEAEGYILINNLMNFFWNAISNRQEFNDIDSRRTTAIAAFGYSIISDNYRQCAKRNEIKDRASKPLSIRYKELRLLTDMIAGMTDGFARDIHEEIKNRGFLDSQ